MESLRLKGQPGFLTVQGVLPDHGIPFQPGIDDMGKLMVQGFFTHQKTV